MLIGSGPFEERYAHLVSEERFSRLGPSGREAAFKLLKIVENPVSNDRSKALAKLGGLLDCVDAYSPDSEESLRNNGVEVDADIFQKVWRDASAFRKTGGLLACIDKLQCPVVVIHGDQDPHPADAVRFPLATKLKDFKFVLLRDCGHKPWIEKKAKKKFYEVLLKELQY